jgi:hypothetical protein
MVFQLKMQSRQSGLRVLSKGTEPRRIDKARPNSYGERLRRVALGYVLL